MATIALVQRIARTRIHYGWVVVGVAFLILLAAAGVRSAPSVFIKPVELEFGWTRTTTSLAISLGLLLYGLIGPFAAALMDRIGVRAVALIAIITMALGMGLAPFIDAPWELVMLWGVVIGIGSGLAAVVLGAVVANRWFLERRSLVMGVMTSSIAAGQLIFLPALATITQASSWRWASILILVVLAAMIPVVAFLMVEYPRDIGLAPYGAKTDYLEGPIAKRENPLMVALNALGDGLVSRDFWLLSLSFFVCGASTNGLIGTHFIPFCVENGVTQVTAAGLLATMGIFNFIGTTGSGWLTDRFDSRHLLFWYYGLRGLSLLFLPYVFDFSFLGLTGFEIFYGLDWIATVPPTVRLAGNAFGLQRAGMMFGWIMAMHQVGSAAIAAAAGILHDQFGTYTSSFLISGILCFFASGAVLMIGKRPGSLEPVAVAGAGA